YRQDAPVDLTLTVADLLDPRSGQWVVPRVQQTFDPLDVELSSIPLEARLSFPWILWHIWKARNSALFEHVRLDSSSVYSRAMEEYEIWRGLNSNEAPVPPIATCAQQRVSTDTWSPPPINWLKCNVGSSWHSGNLISGAAWLVRDNNGASLCSLLQSIMHSLLHFDEWSLEYVVLERNQAATLIAVSVTRDHRYQSYVARGGPSWL
ncbi:unnamed protein product, partial [Brassica oleracea]